MDDTLIASLLEDLKSDDEGIREYATQELWRIWFHQKGVYGLEHLSYCQRLMDQGQLDQAETELNQIIADLPDFAEAWNRRAVLHYMRRDYRKSLIDCDRVIMLNPVHFGALHGKGLCHAGLGEYVSAIQSFRRALEIQPYALVNQRLILECTARL